MGKCEFFDVCNIADKDSVTCAKHDGDYYGAGRMGGCGRNLMEFGKKSTYHKEYVEVKREKIK